MKENRWLYLPMEIKVRELDAKLLLAYYASRQGYRIILGEHRMVELAAADFPGGVFFSKGYPERDRTKIIKQAMANGHKVVELDEEGLLTPDINKYLNSRMTENMLEVVKHEFCWGEFQKKIISEAYPRLTHKCHVVGNPRFDLLHPKYRSLSASETQKIHEKYGEYILINTRFPLYNGSQRKRENASHPILQYMKQLYDCFIEMTQVLAIKFPHTNFVLRPHPAENKASYHEVFSSYKNVHIVHDGNIIKWLMASKAVIHNGCTSSIEAFLLEKPIITYMPITSGKFDVALPNELGVKASEVKEVAMILNSVLSKSKDNEFFTEQHLQNKRQLLNHFYKRDNGAFSYQSILRLMDTIRTEIKKPPIINKKYAVKANRKLDHLFPALAKEEIESFIMQLDKVENTQNSIRITKLGDNLYSLASIDEQ